MTLKKKLYIILFVLSGFGLTGCEPETQEERDAYMEGRITEFYYKGHRYLRYKTKYSNRGYAGIAHDPDCPCREKGDSI